LADDSVNLFFIVSVTVVWLSIYIIQYGPSILSCFYSLIGNTRTFDFSPETIDCRYNGALSLELSNDHPNMHIIHRKVALILGQWVSEVK
jgi:hypothetical protein